MALTLQRMKGAIVMFLICAVGILFGRVDAAGNDATPMVAVVENIKTDFSIRFEGASDNFTSSETIIIEQTANSYLSNLILAVENPPWEHVVSTIVNLRELTFKDGSQQQNGVGEVAVLATLFCSVVVVDQNGNRGTIDMDSLLRDQIHHAELAQLLMDAGLDSGKTLLLFITFSPSVTLDTLSIVNRNASNAFIAATTGKYRNHVAAIVALSCTTTIFMLYSICLWKAQRNSYNDTQEVLSPKAYSWSVNKSRSNVKYHKSPTSDDVDEEVNEMHIGALPRQTNEPLGELFDEEDDGATELENIALSPTVSSSSESSPLSPSDASHRRPGIIGIESIRRLRGTNDFTP